MAAPQVFPPSPTLPRPFACPLHLNLEIDTLAVWFGKLAGCFPVFSLMVVYIWHAWVYNDGLVSQLAGYTWG